jgi:small-conductance mechanosensitive channel
MNSDQEIIVKKHDISWRPLKPLLAILALVLAAVIAITYLNYVFPFYSYIFKYVYAGMIMVGGVFISRELANLVARELSPKLEKNALVVSNIVAVGGYLVSAVVALSYASVSPTTILAGAAFSGLVLGLALQPTLGSFFAGILLLVSGAIRPGSQVRIMTWHIPFQWAFLPGYKYFSPDQIYAGYMAQVIEIGLFFTTIVTEEGQTMKIPNTIIATDAAVVTYTNKDYIFNVRYEFPNKFDPELVLKRIHEETKDFPVLHVYINEQSDKEYYIVKLILNAKEKDHALLKSQILTRFIKLHKELNEEKAVGAK